HIGDITTRFRNVTPRIVSGLNRSTSGSSRSWSASARHPGIREASRAWAVICVSLMIDRLLLLTVPSRQLHPILLAREDFLGQEEHHVGRAGKPDLLDGSSGGKARPPSLPEYYGGPGRIAKCTRDGKYPSRPPGVDLPSHVPSRLHISILRSPRVEDGSGS